MFRFASFAIATVLAASTAMAEQKTITFSHLANPSHEAALWAVKQGKVTSDKIKIEVTPLDIAALQQAIAARTFDVVEGAAMAIPRANARGLPLKIIGTAQRAHSSGEGSSIWVKADSPLKTIEDLKGKRLGGYTLSSAGMTLNRIALSQVYGLNIDAKGGDVQFVELPESALAASLAAGNVDAATLIHSQNYEARKSGDFRVLAELGKGMAEKFGMRTITSVLVGYGDKLEQDPESYQEFLRLFRASVDYAMANQDEVFTAVAKQESIDREFFDLWFNSFTEIPVFISQGDLDAIDMLWTESTKLGVLDVPFTKALEATWDKAIFEGEIKK